MGLSVLLHFLVASSFRSRVVRSAGKTCFLSMVFVWKLTNLICPTVELVLYFTDHLLVLSFLALCSPHLCILKVSVHACFFGLFSYNGSSVLLSKKSL